MTTTTTTASTTTTPAPWMIYFTIVLTWTERRTMWHPHEATGPFSTLTRGAFGSELAARIWAEQNIPGHAYDIARIECEVDGSDTFEQYVGK